MMVWLREINAEVWDQFPLSPDQILKLHSTKATFISTDYTKLFGKDAMIQIFVAEYQNLVF